jgi:1-acyl-sn-glycerol-3-phosphate acyltransferase
VNAAVIGRDTLIAAITKFLSDRDAGTLAEIRRVLNREMDAAGPDAIADLGERFAKAGADWQFYPRDPLARRIHQVLADTLLDRRSTVVGAEHAAALDDKPVVIFANHLSYSDANLLDVLFQRSPAAALSDRLTAMAGPKVYSSPKRRFSSLCFGTIKTPQNHSLSTEDATMSARDVARAARRSIEIAHERLRLGEALLVFGEGRRSRTGSLQPMLAGATRYLDGPAAWILPVGIAGTEAMFPIEDERLRSVPIVARVGRPIDASVLRKQAGGSRRLMADALGIAIAELLPAGYRGIYGDEAADLGDAMEVWRGVSAVAKVADRGSLAG